MTSFAYSLNPYKDKGIDVGCDYLPAPSVAALLLLLYKHKDMVFEVGSGHLQLGVSSDELDLLVQTGYVVVENNCILLTGKSRASFAALYNAFNERSHFEERKRLGKLLVESVGQAVDTSNSVQEMLETVQETCQQLAGRQSMAVDVQLGVRPRSTTVSCASHCCPVHGCKYDHWDCPVELGIQAPVYSENNGCESCEYDREVEDFSDDYEF